MTLIRPSASTDATIVTDVNPAEPALLISDDPPRVWPYLRIFTRIANALDILHAPVLPSPKEPE